MLDQLVNTMTDRTNAPYVDTSETSHEWAERVGQEHDTWHRPDGGGSMPVVSVEGNLNVYLAYSSVIKQAPLWGVERPVVGSVYDLTVNGEYAGRQIHVSGQRNAEGEWSYHQNTDGTQNWVEFANVDLDGVDYKAMLTPLEGQVVTFGWSLYDGDKPPPPPAPVVTSMVPDPVPFSTVVEDARVYGTGFVDGSVVYWGLSTPGERATTFISDTELSFELAPQGVAGSYQVLVRNPDGQESDPLTVEVPGPPPTVTSVSPNIAAQHDMTVRDVTVVGTGFKLVGATRVFIGTVEQNQGSVYVANATTLEFDLAANMGLVEGEHLLTVQNPDGGVSNGIPFTITPGFAPTLTSVTPNTSVAGVGSELTVIGTDFAPVLGFAYLDAVGTILTNGNTGSVSPTEASVPSPTTLPPGDYFFKVFHGDSNRWGSAVSLPFTVTP
jgi:hypothetical protein